MRGLLRGADGGPLLGDHPAEGPQRDGLAVRLQTTRGSRIQHWYLLLRDPGADPNLLEDPGPRHWHGRHPLVALDGVQVSYCFCLFAADVSAAISFSLVKPTDFVDTEYK